MLRDVLINAELELEHLCYQTNQMWLVRASRHSWTT